MHTVTSAFKRDMLRSVFQIAGVLTIVGIVAFAVVGQAWAHPEDEADQATTVVSADSDAGASVAINEDGSVSVTRSFDTGWVCDSVAFTSSTSANVTAEVGELDGSLVDSLYDEAVADREETVGLCEREHGEVTKVISISMNIGQER